jgi:NAD(P)H-nitrite reductase large subunit
VIQLAVSVWIAFRYQHKLGASNAVAIELEQRYKGIWCVLLHPETSPGLTSRAPHKGGVSGCVRECAEAQSKDFGLIASDTGWNSTNSANHRCYS